MNEYHIIEIYHVLKTNFIISRVLWLCVTPDHALFHPFKELCMLLIHIYLRMFGWIRDACVFWDCKCVCVIGEMYKIQY